MVTSFTSVINTTRSLHSKESSFIIVQLECFSGKLDGVEEKDLVPVVLLLESVCGEGPITLTKNDGDG
jgi:hypothetical protein